LVDAIDHVQYRVYELQESNICTTNKREISLMSCQLTIRTLYSISYSGTRSISVRASVGIWGCGGINLRTMQHTSTHSCTPVNNTHVFKVHKLSKMADIPTFDNLSLERHDNVFVLTMQKPPENRLNSAYCQEMIRAYRTVEKILGSGSEGAVITRGNDTKFWCTVSLYNVYIEQMLTNGRDWN
jgi:hypothetical protein